MIDVAVIGGGPAGAAAALEARCRGLSVAIWEKDRYPRDKVCGEFISAESIPLLESYIPETLTRAARMTRAEFISPRGGLRWFSLAHAACGLSRRALDEALWRAVLRAGSEAREGVGVRAVRRQCNASDTAWRIETDNGVEEEARALVVACGRWWNIEGLDSPADKKRKSAAGNWIGAKAHFRGMAARGAVEMYYFPGGYCGIAPIEDGLHNACCLVHRSLVGRAPAGGAGDFCAWIRAVARHPNLDERLRNASQASATVTTAPVRPARRCAAQGEVLLVGDAAGFLDPFTGDGISMALQSGRLAIETLRAAIESSTGFRQAGMTYKKRLAQSVRRSYAVAAIFRSLVRAPESIQNGAAAIVLPLGARLHAETRWRTGGPNEAKANL